MRNRSDSQPGQRAYPSGHPRRSIGRTRARDRVTAGAALWALLAAASCEFSAAGSPNDSTPIASEPVTEGPTATQPPTGTDSAPVSDTDATPPQPRHRLRAELVDGDADSTASVLRIVDDAAARPTPVLELECVSILGSTGSLRLPFESSERDGEHLRIRCTQHAEHLVELDISPAPGMPGRLRIELIDRVPYRTRVREVRLDFRPLGELAKPRRIEAPTHTQRSDATGTEQTSTDRGWRVPLLWHEAEDLAIEIQPDLELQNRNRRMPWQLAWHRARDGRSLLRCGLAADADRDDVRTTGEPGVLVRDEHLRCAYSVQLHTLNDEPIHIESIATDPLHRLLEAIWNENSDTGLKRAPLPLHAAPHEGPTFDELVARNAERLAGRVEGEVQTPTGSVRAPLIRDGSGVRLELDRGGAVADSLLSARSLEPTMELLARVPSRAGILPHAWLRYAETGESRWLVADPEGELSDHRRTAESCFLLGAALEALETDSTAAATAEIADTIAERADALTELLLSSQRADGTLPACHQPRTLTPVGIAPRADQALCAWFLAICADLLPDPSGARRRGAELALARALRRLAPDDARPDADRLVDLPTLELSIALRAACRLGATGSLRSAAHELLFRQQSFQPTWRRDAPLGGFAKTCSSAALDGRSSALGARALLDASRTTGDIRFAIRAGCALRAALLQNGGGPALGALEHARHMFGDAVIDPQSQRFASLSELWHERLTAGDDGTPGQLRITSHASHRRDEPARVSILPLLSGTDTPPRRLRIEAWPTGATIDLPTAAAWPPARYDLPVWSVPYVHLGLPELLAPGTTAWSPRVQCTGPMSPSSRFTIEVTLPGGDVLRSRMERTDRDELVPVAPLPLPRLQQQIGAELAVELIEEDGPRRRRHPPRTSDGVIRAKRVRVDRGRRIDLGASLRAPELQGPDLPIQPFVDGRRDALVLQPQQEFELHLQIPPRAASIDLRWRVSGSFIVTVRGADGEPRPVGSYRDLAPELPRTVRLQLADRRLWRDGRLELRMSCSGGNATRFATLDYSVDGIYSANGIAEPSKTRPAAPGERLAKLSPRGGMPARVRVQVIPLGPPGHAPVDQEALRLAWFGGVEYRMTVSERPSLTRGSAKRWIAELSGGLTELVGEITPDESIAVPTEHRTSAADLLAALRTRLMDRIPRSDLSTGEAIDAIVFIWTGEAPLDGARFAVSNTAQTAGSEVPPLVLLPVQHGSGELLAVGDLVESLLRAIAGGTDLGTPEHGNLGQLALSSTTDRHLPAHPAAANLAATGWIDVFEGPVADRELTLGESLRDRVGVQLEVDNRLGGDLWLEVRRSSRTDPSDAGLLLLRRYRDDARPWVKPLGSAPTRVSALRLSPQRTPAATPLAPARRGDLFRSAVRLDDRSGPNLFPASFAAPFRIVDVRMRDGTLMARTEALADDLSIDVERTVEVVGSGGDESPESSLRRHVLALRRPHPDRLERLFAKLSIPAVTEPVAYEVTVAGRRAARIDLPASREPRGLHLDLDLPAGAEDRIELRCDLPASAPAPVLERAVCMPHSDPRDTPQFAELERRAVQLDAEALHVASAWTLTPDGEPTSGLVLLPAGPCALALAVARAPGSGTSGAGGAATPRTGGRPTRLRAELRELDGADHTVLLDGFVVPPADGRVHHLLLELPAGDRPRSALIDLTAQLGGSEALVLVDARIAR